jgi:hypothetical protein
MFVYSHHHFRVDLCIITESIVQLRCFTFDSEQIQIVCRLLHDTLSILSYIQHKHAIHIQQL